MEVTRNEVDSAAKRGASHALVLIHSINVEMSGEGPAARAVGEAVVYDPCLPEDSELKPQSYVWEPDMARTYVWPTCERTARQANPRTSATRPLPRCLENLPRPTAR